MPAVYPINSYAPIIPFDGDPDPAFGTLGQIGVDVSSAKYYQKIGAKWYPFGSGPGEPVLTTLSAAVGTDNSPADGATSNSVIFTALDQNGQPMGGSLTVTLSSETANAAPSVDINPTTGTATVIVRDTVAETVTVTGDAGGGKTAAANVVFVAVQAQGFSPA